MLARVSVRLYFETTAYSKASIDLVIFSFIIIFYVFSRDSLILHNVFMKFWNFDSFGYLFNQIVVTPGKKEN
jgi:hypothetical protein